MATSSPSCPPSSSSRRSPSSCCARLRSASASLLLFPRSLPFSPRPLDGGGLGWGWATDEIAPVAPPSLTLPRKGGGDSKEGGGEVRKRERGFNQRLAAPYARGVMARSRAWLLPLQA